MDSSNTVPSHIRKATTRAEVVARRQPPGYELEHCGGGVAAGIFPALFAASALRDLTHVVPEHREDPVASPVSPPW